MTTFDLATLALSALALIGSLWSLLYTAKTYMVTQRPYVGIVDSAFQLVESPPRAIVWKLILKNVGPIPAMLTVVRNQATLSVNDSTTKLPSLGSIGNAKSLVMPGQTMELSGQYSEVGNDVVMADVLSGAAILDLHVDLSYIPPGRHLIGKRRYTAQVRFHAGVGFGPGFAMVSVEAD